MDPRYLLPSSGFNVEPVNVEADGSTLCLKINAQQKAGMCPYCGQRSERIHSWYERHPQDVSCSGRNVRLQVSVRRFFCDNLSCQHRVFSERFPGLVAPYARRTDRLSDLLQGIGLMVGCSMGVEIMGYLPVTTSRWTVARALRRLVPGTRPTPCVLGIDDWAIRRGHRYGTILVDLQHGQIVEVLPDREADSVAAWLQAHPGVEVVSRDRAGAYAEGARRGAPHAVQVADRWHLLKNLGEALTSVFARHKRDLKQWEAARRAVTRNPCPPTAVPAVPSAAFQRRNARFVQVRHWRDDGLTINAIAALCHLDRKTVRKYLNTDQCPNGHYPRHHRASKLAPFQAYLFEHADDGQRTVRQLYCDIQAQGFTGSLSTVATFLAAAHHQPLVSAQPVAAGDPVLKSPTSPLTPRRATWLLLARPDQLTQDQQALALHIAHLNLDIEQMASEAQSFVQMLRQHLVDSLDPWLDRTLHSTVRELRTFARGIQRDYQAVKAALALPWSNGPVEGFVNLIKFCKRQMFGRANFDLLRIRVLIRPSPTLQQKCT